jgi:alpha-L-arabinofuranosidase
MHHTRRDLLRAGSVLTASTALGAAPDALVVDPKPLFDISPYLYMQFMEPLGATDSSVEAAWDYDRDDWRSDFIEAIKDLAPDTMRWGGLYSRYYKWRDGVGPADRRPLTRNYVWGGKETNRVGTPEFVDFCRRVGAEPLICVNFLSDGQRKYWSTKEGNRSGDATEAADWVSYANDPDNKERRNHGHAQPFGIKLWQIGNETSYGKECFTRDESIVHTIEFSKAMKQRDPSIKILGWGDKGDRDGGLWAPELLRRAGEHIDYVAVHMMGMNPKRPDTVLRDRDYQQQPQKAWDELIEMGNIVERRVTELEQTIVPFGKRVRIAITEGHLGLGSGNANLILTEWLSAVYHARCLNTYQRHGEMVRITTAADFEGTRWTVNAVILPVPRGRTYLTPAGSIMRLFKRHNGKQGVAVKSAPAGLDVCASRTGSKVYLHVANMNYSRAASATFGVEGNTVAGGTVHAIAPGSPREYVSVDRPDVFAPKRAELSGGQTVRWTFPAASVSVVELELKNA